MEHVLHHALAGGAQGTEMKREQQRGQCSSGHDGAPASRAVRRAQVGGKAEPCVGGAPERLAHSLKNSTNSNGRFYSQKLTVSKTGTVGEISYGLVLNGSKGLLVIFRPTTVLLHLKRPIFLEMQNLVCRREMT